MITSPNTVLANSLIHATDILRPRLEFNKPRRVEFSVGTQINGIPHIGTYIVLTSAFVLAQEVEARYGVPCEVSFGALDNAPYDTVAGYDGSIFQRAYAHAIPSSDMTRLIGNHYVRLFDQLTKITGVKSKWRTYTEQQALPEFRGVFLETLQKSAEMGWCVAPSNGQLRIRLPCQDDGYYAQKRAEGVHLARVTEQDAVFQCVSRAGTIYEVQLTRDGCRDGVYLDVNRLHRNVIKEAVYAKESDVLGVMVKGGDWTMSTQPIDWALGVLGYSATQVPMRLFTPQILTDTGAKLSKSLIRDGDASMSHVPEWMLNMGRFVERNADYAEKMVWLVRQFLSHPRHMFRSYTYHEVVRLLHAYQADEEGL